jgi:CheY-like chemotaxis protein
VTSAEVPVSSKDNYQSVTRQACRPLSILLADDNRINRTLGLRILEKQGHVVTCVVDGEKAVQATGKSSYDVILMDVQMPVMDGFEATRRIRMREQANQQPRTVIIALTAHAMKGDEERCLEQDMDDYLSKPLKIEQLTSKLQKWFSDAESASTLALCDELSCFTEQLQS